MGTIANAKVTHYYNCYNGDFIGCLHKYLYTKIKFSHFIIQLILNNQNSFTIYNFLIY